MADPAEPAGPLTRQQVLDYLEAHGGRAGKRELARHFGVTGSGRVALKQLMRELERDGLLDRKAAAGPARRPRISLPPVLVLEVVGPDEGGELLARPALWERPGPPPTLYLTDAGGQAAALGAGDRVLARVERGGDGRTATIIRALPRLSERVVGLYERLAPGRASRAAVPVGRIRPADRRDRDELTVEPGDAGDAESGDLVLAEVLPGTRFGRRGRILERLGRMGEPQTISLLAIAQYQIPDAFAPEALAEAAAAAPVAVGDDGRADLTQIPLVTIDGADARDFDDAVFAEPDDDPANPGGWHLIVAIADVAHYVRPGSALDRAAYERGNSVYFPDRVVPMLPEALSNELCSLKPGVPRACLAAHLWIDSRGRKLSHRFVRGVMRSAARLTYEQVQDALEGADVSAAGGLLHRVLRPLDTAYRALAEARAARGTLDLDVPEMRIRVDAGGRVVGAEPRERLDSHRLIEEMMILANVAAAEALEAARQPCMYRVHDQPAPEKMEALAELVAGFGLKLAKGQVVRPQLFTGLLARAAGLPQARMIHEMVLRSQAQANYSPDNIGHFGLALPRYAHFTSPIRRYADLLVHRGLIAGLGLGDPEAHDHAWLVTAGAQISATERRAAQAEREVVERYLAAYLAGAVGQHFAATVTGVARFGLFVTLGETGATGLIPVRGLPDDFYVHDERQQRLVGERTGLVFALGDPIEAVLVEADALTGGLLFDAVVAESPTIAARPRPRPSRRAKPPRGPVRRRSK